MSIFHKIIQRCQKGRRNLLIHETDKSNTNTTDKKLIALTFYNNVIIKISLIPSTELHCFGIPTEVEDNK